MRNKYMYCTVLSIMCIGLLSGCGKSNNTNEMEESEIETESTSQDGYYYDEFGVRYSIGNTEMTAEDVIYAYIKSLSLLDFNSALQYVYTNSAVVDGYDSNDAQYFGGTTGYGVAYNFNHKIYKLTLESLLVSGVTSTVIYPDSYVLTLDIEHLDCNNNEFWLKDKDTIYANLLTYKLEEEDSDAENKITEYLAQYIKDYYASDKAPTAVNEVELTLVHSITGAWVIEDDSDLYALCAYNDGEYIIKYIKNAFNDWYTEYLNELEVEG